ncbi:MAG: hypothetical protein ACRC8B_22670 [Aeromonas sobria]|uniref:hypothetical protein n=1 Tax=Aeromonas sobria TaxID=646 RepID=UPI003F416CB3
MKIDSGQLVAYLGGSGVGVVSLSTKAGEIAGAGTIPLMALHLPVVQVTLGDVVALGGFIVVVARFVWDIRKDKRKRA